jgi:TPP-dependent pyruvate/acetoin dehydrogenase alpha subunit
MDLKYKLFANMYRIRAIEEEIANRYPKGEMRCPVHLSIGQEAVPAIFAENVAPNDFALSTHRGHAHYLAKGGNLKAMIAEIYGKATGCSKGKGGSMHLIDLNVNFMGTTAIVGNTIPVAVGLALSSQLNKTDQISCVFFGDGAVEEGVFYESVNFAIVRNLPVIFICENNLYSVYSPLSVRQPKKRQIFQMVEALGIKAYFAAGEDIFNANDLMKSIFNDVRAGNGPRFLEFSTYRWREHCGPDYDNNIGYRSQEEFESWQSKDPLNKLHNVLNKNSESKKIIDTIKQNIHVEIEQAFSYALSSPFPSQSDAYKHVYAD